MGVTKTHDLRAIELEIEEIISSGYIMPFRCVRGSGLIIEERFLLALLDIASRKQHCRNAIRNIVKQIYDGDLLDNAYEDWREKWLEKP